MKHGVLQSIFSLSLGLMLASVSQAHVTLLDGAAAAGSGYRAALRVGHGCEGAPTTALKVTIPDGFNGAQPMPKAGWTVATKTGKLAEAFEAHGKKFTEGVQEITWIANTPESALPDAFYDEFVFRGSTPKKAGVIWFKVVQSCTKGSNEWVEVPVKGATTKGLKFPAAKLDVLDVQAIGGHAH